jgi:thiol-disulfide isomerase/thioredoxin
MRHRLSLLIALSASLPACAAPERPPTRTPSALPAVSLRSLDGAQTDLAGFLHGRPALVSLWATWCDTCIEEAPALNRLERELERGGDALVIGVAVGEEEAAVRNFARTRRLDFAQFLDTDFRFADTLGERQVPATLVVDRAGRIVFRGKRFDTESLSAFRRAVAGR